MKIKYESSDNFPLGKKLNIPGCVKMNIKMKMILIPLYK